MLFNENAVKITDNQVGTILCNFLGFEGKLRQGDYQAIQLEDFPIDACELSNGNLLLAFEKNCLKIYDLNFVLNKQKFIDKQPNSLTTNFAEKIFVFCTDNTILMMDLQLREQERFCLNTISKNKSLFIVRNYIHFNSDLLYICEKEENCITRLSYKSGFKCHSKFYFDYSPIQIQIANDLACVSFVDELNKEYLNFYDLTNFQRKCSYLYSKSQNTKDGNIFFGNNKRIILSLCAHDSSFFVLCKCGKSVDCYNKEGLKGDTIRLDANKSSRTEAFMKVYRNHCLMHVFDKVLMFFKTD